MRLDDNETRISGAWRANVTGVGAWEPSCQGFGIAKIPKKLQLHPRKGCHPVDIGQDLRRLSEGPGSAAFTMGGVDMFAPPVAKPKAKTASNSVSPLHRAAPFGQRHGNVEQAPMFGPLPQVGASLNAHGTPEQDVGPASMSAKGGPPRPSWNFCKLPAYSPGREKRVENMAAESHSERYTPDAGLSAPIARGVAWNFSRVPAYAPGREDGLQPSYPQAATRPPMAIQAKLMIGQANDPLEHEADQVADQVMQGSTSHPVLTGATPRLHRKYAACEPEDDTDTMLQKKRAGPDASGMATPALAQAALRSPGHPLPAAERAFFEPRFGQDFSQVRVHTDDQAARSSAALGAVAYTSGPHIVFARSQYNPGSANGRHLIAHELVHVLQQTGGAAPHVQRRTINSSTLEDIQGLPMPNLLARLDTLPRAVLLDEEAGGEVGGPRLVLAMRAVRAKRERDIIGFLQANTASLQSKSIPPNQFAEILAFLGQPEQSEREDFNFALEVPVVVVKPSDARLRGEPAPRAERSVDNDEGAEPISDFEAQILLDRSRIMGAVLDPDTGEIIGYRVPATTGLRRITDRNGATVFEMEAPVESPLLDPIDFIPSPGAVAKVVTVGGKFAIKAAAGIGGKIVLKEAAAAAAAKSAKTGSTLTLGVIFRLRQVSKALAKPLSKAGGKAGGKAVFGAGKTLLRPVAAQAVKATGPIDEALLEAAVKSRSKLVEAGVDWAKSNVATAKLLVNGKTVILAVDNPEWALHAEGAIMTEVRNLTASGKAVKVLQVFSERIPCGPGYANCMTNLAQAFPTAEIFYGVSGAMNEGTTARALQVMYGLIK